MKITSPKLFACFFAGNPFSNEGPDTPEDAHFIVSARSHEHAVEKLEVRIAEEGRQGFQPFGEYGSRLDLTERGETMVFRIYRVHEIGEAAKELPEDVFFGPMFRRESYLVDVPCWTRDYPGEP